MSGEDVMVFLSVFGPGHSSLESFSSHYIFYNARAYFSSFVHIWLQTTGVCRHPATAKSFFRAAKQSARKAFKIASYQLSTRQPIGWRLLLDSRQLFKNRYLLNAK
jgi:hypothetical protein